MIVKYLMLLIFGLVVVTKYITCQTEKPINWKFYQKDYEITGARVEIVWYNKTYVEDFVTDFGIWDNDTSRPINITVRLLKEITDDCKIEGAVFKLSRDKYQPLPIAGVINPCLEYKRNKAYVLKLLVEKSKIITNGPRDGCPVKADFYYAYNIVPDYSLLPPHLPRGSYKIVGRAYHQSDFVGEAHVYGTVLDKPKDKMKKKN